MLLLNHECFTLPKTNCTLWRYMDLPKLLSLLEGQELILPRADKFEDPYEGTWSTAVINEVEEQVKSGNLSQAYRAVFHYAKQMREEIFISCWHMNEHESAAMWKLYLTSNQGIAIKSDIDSLTEAVEGCPHTTGIGAVSYLDYDKQNISLQNGLYPFVHKRVSFAHENEVRVVVWIPRTTGQTPNHQTLIKIPINPRKLIKAVHVEPTAPGWFAELVAQLLKRYELEVPVVRSTLYEHPHSKHTIT